MNMLSDKKSVSGLVSNIQRFSLNDGPGIRTVVFLKGCPLKCPWCHNPESRRFYPEIMLDEKKCVGCGQCTKTCTLHHFVDGQHFIDRERCKHCGLCARICPTNALTLVGKCMTVEEIYQEAMQDYGFGGESGGITLSGGEPLAQPEFSMAILRQFHEKGIHCAIETSGYAPWEVNLDQINDLNTLSNRVATVAADSAKVFLALVPMLIVYPFAQKYFIHGIVQGSVKE